MIGLPIADTQTVEDSGPDILKEASFQLANMDTFVGNMAREATIDGSSFGFEGSGLNNIGPKLSPEELNKKYTDVQTPFTTPMSEMAAMHLNDEGLRRKQLQEAMAKAPGGDFYKGTVNFAQGIVAHAMDPVEFGVGAAAGWVFKLAGGMMAASSMGGIARAGQVLSKGGFVYDAAEGIAGNAALEPYQISSAKKAQIEYSWKDSAMNVVGGGLAFPGLKYVGGKALDLIQKLPKSLGEITQKTGLGQIYNDKVPNVEAAKQAYDDVAYNSPKTETPDVKVVEKADAHPEVVANTEGQLKTFEAESKKLVEEPSTARMEYSYEPKTAEELKQGKLYIASKQAGTLDGGSRPVGDLRFGEDGLYITDNPRAANNIAAHPLDTDGPHGDVFEMGGEYLNLVDLDTTGKEIFDELEVSDKKLKKILRESEDVLDAYDRLSEEAHHTGDETQLQAFREALRNAGYDGFKHSDDVQGHNSAYVFPESVDKMTREGMIKSDAASVPMPDQNKLNAAREQVMSPSNEIHHDPVLQQEFDTFKPVEDVEITKRAEEVAEKIKMLDELEKSGVIKDKEDLAAIQKFKENKAKGEAMVKVIEDFTNCLLAGVD